jgi:hypothetical protein
MRADDRQRELKRRIKDTAVALHQEGTFPSWYKIRKRLGENIFKEKSARDAYEEVLMELGYSDE